MDLITGAHKGSSNSAMYTVAQKLTFFCNKAFTRKSALQRNPDLWPLLGPTQSVLIREVSSSQGF